jgi:curved DNA-binding protein CbpA
MNAYQVLGLAERLDVSEDALAVAFREAGKRLHPDAGGGEGDFNGLQQAREILASPSKRLRHWMELRGIVLDPRGAVSAGLMDFFAEIGAATQAAEAVIRKREAARSALAKALLENEIQMAREAVEALQGRIGVRICEACAGFAELEETPDGEVAARLARDLAFLEKWRAALRAMFSRLV